MFTKNLHECVRASALKATDTELFRSRNRIVADLALGTCGDLNDSI